MGCSADVKMSGSYVCSKAENTKVMFSPYTEKGLKAHDILSKLDKLDFKVTFH